MNTALHNGGMQSVKITCGNNENNYELPPYCFGPMPDGVDNPTVKILEIRGRLHLRDHKTEKCY